MKFNISILLLTSQTFNTIVVMILKNLRGMILNIEKMKKILSDVYYPNGESFPEVRILVDSDNSRNIFVL